MSDSGPSITSQRPEPMQDEARMYTALCTHTHPSQCIQDKPIMCTSSDNDPLARARQGSVEEGRPREGWTRMSNTCFLQGFQTRQPWRIFSWDSEDVSGLFLSAVRPIVPYWIQGVPLALNITSTTTIEWFTYVSLT